MGNKSSRCSFSRFSHRSEHCPAYKGLTLASCVCVCSTLDDMRTTHPSPISFFSPLLIPVATPMLASCWTLPQLINYFKIFVPTVPSFFTSLPTSCHIVRYLGPFFTMDIVIVLSNCFETECMPYNFTILQVHVPYNSKNITDFMIQSRLRVIVRHSFIFLT